jgi:hypothetical protein
MNTDKRRRSAKDDDEDEETIAYRRKRPRIQEIRQYLAAHTIVLAAHYQVADRLQSTKPTKNTRNEWCPSHHAEAHDYEIYKTSTDSEPQEEGDRPGHHLNQLKHSNTRDRGRH